METSAAPATPANSRESWVRALLSSAEKGDPAILAGARRRVAIVAAALAILFVLMAFGVGLRSATSDPSLGDTLAAGVAIQHGLVALGLFALGAVLLGVAERMFFGSRTGRSD